MLKQLYFRKYASKHSMQRIICMYTKTYKNALAKRNAENYKP